MKKNETLTPSNKTEEIKLENTCFPIMNSVRTVCISTASLEFNETFLCHIDSTHIC